MRKHPQNFEGGVLRDAMAEPTLFEKILSGEIPGNFICRGNGWGSFLDVFPRSEGHTLVVLENPSQRLADLSEADLGLLFGGVKKTQEALTAYFNTGQEIPHVHVHVIPRLEGDGGGALPWMFPNAKPPNPPNFSALSQLCTSIKEANQ